MARKIIPHTPKMLKGTIPDIERLDPKEIGQAMDRFAAENIIAQELDGLQFVSTKKFIEYADTFPANAPEGFYRRLLQMATDRLRRSKTEEPEYHVASMRQTSLSNPTQYDGILEDGDQFFVRYTGHKLCVYIDDHLVDYQELPESLHPNRIELGQLRMLCRSLFTFPEDDAIILKRL